MLVFTSVLNAFGHLVLMIQWWFWFHVWYNGWTRLTRPSTEGRAEVSNVVYGVTNFGGPGRASFLSSPRCPGHGSSNGL